MNLINQKNALRWIDHFQPIYGSVYSGPDGLDLCEVFQ